MLPEHVSQRVKQSERGRFSQQMYIPTSADDGTVNSGLKVVGVPTSELVVDITF